VVTDATPAGPPAGLARARSRVLRYLGTDCGFSSYQGVCLIDRGWRAHNLFLMMLIGGRS
jgi:hypothetical protein